MKILFLFSVYSFQDDLSGQALLDVVFAKLNLIETAYFGLRYLDAENQTVCQLMQFVSMLLIVFQFLALVGRVNTTS